MSESDGVATPLDALASLHEEWKYGLGRNLSIVRSSSAIVSTAASATLIWIIFRSRSGTDTTYHRLLLGLSASDLLLSLSLTTFGAAVPKELSYIVWNARGSQASCDAMGFVEALGAYSGLIYMCSLNLYYLAKVRFNKTDSYIAKKLEPWLHAVPALYGSILSIVLVAKQGINADVSGFCSASYTYDPPHCDGCEDGNAPEGFEIPCGRGRSAELIIYVMGYITGLVVPVTIGISLWTIYRSVVKTERRSRRYSARALHANPLQPASHDDATASFSILSAVNRRFGGRASATSFNNQDSSQSRAVLHKAVAYSAAYFVTWIWLIIYGVVYLAGAWPTKSPQPKWQIAYVYVWVFFTPLQGLWTLLIYMQPSVIKRKGSSEGNISWSRAFADALWSAVSGPNNSTGRGGDQAGPGAPRTAAAPRRMGTNRTPAPCHEERNTSATIGSSDREGNLAHAESLGLRAEDVEEEEKRETQEYELSV